MNSTPLELIADPNLREPLLVLAFGGWSDAGDAATGAGRHLLERHSAWKIARIDCEEFLDFTVVRPRVANDEQGQRTIQWPDHQFFALNAPGVDFDLVIGLGVEPHMRWRSYCEVVVDLAKTLGVKRAVLLGAFLDEVIYSQPVPVIATTSPPEVAAEMGLEASRYEGPTGIVGVLGDRLRDAGIQATSLWARLPHYVTRTPHSRAVLALLEQLAVLGGFRVDVSDLRADADAFDEAVSEDIKGDPQLSAYVRELKKRAFSG